MIPHTLEEQKALLTAEAEGKVIYLVAVEAGGIGRVEKNSPGFWDFRMGRYEVEQPLMEEWKVVASNGRVFGTYNNPIDAQVRMGASRLNHPELDPFRVVHLREVR